MVKKTTIIPEQPVFIVQPGFKILLAGLLFTLFAMVLLWLGNDDAVYIIIGSVNIICASFYYLLYFAVRIHVYKDYLVIRDMRLRERVFSFKAIFIVDLKQDRWYGTSEKMIVDSNKARIVIISEYYIQYNEFCKLMRQRGRVLQMEQ